MNDLVAGMLDSFDDVLVSIQRLFCKHRYWIPAIYDRQGAKLCGDCGKRAMLTDAEFYSEFGATLNHVLAVKQLPQNVTPK